MAHSGTVTWNRLLPADIPPAARPVQGAFGLIAPALRDTNRSCCLWNRACLMRNNVDKLA
jgi:hypothetical protein